MVVPGSDISRPPSPIPFEEDHLMPRLSSRNPGVLVLFAGIVVSLTVVGCSSKKEYEENQAATHLRKIMQAYDEACYKGRPPKNMDEFRPYIQQVTQAEDLDAYLRSPNDGEPYEIVWGIDLERVSSGGLLLAYEKKGVDGKRYAINAARVVKQLSDEEINSLSPLKSGRSAQR
jgi:hypothetical protein